MLQVFQNPSELSEVSVPTFPTPPTSCGYYILILVFLINIYFILHYRECCWSSETPVGSVQSLLNQQLVKQPLKKNLWVDFHDTSTLKIIVLQNTVRKFPTPYPGQVLLGFIASIIVTQPMLNSSHTPVKTDHIESLESNWTLQESTQRQTMDVHDSLASHTCTDFFCSVRGLNKSNIVNSPHLQ